MTNPDPFVPQLERHPTALERNGHCSSFLDALSEHGRAAPPRRAMIHLARALAEAVATSDDVSGLVAQVVHWQGTQVLAEIAHG